MAMWKVTRQSSGLQCWASLAGFHWAVSPHFARLLPQRHIILVALKTPSKRQIFSTVHFPVFLWSFATSTNKTFFDSTKPLIFEFNRFCFISFWNLLNLTEPVSMFQLPASCNGMGCLVAVWSTSMFTEALPGAKWHRWPGCKTPHISVLASHALVLHLGLFQTQILPIQSHFTCHYLQFQYLNRRHFHKRT